MSGMPKGWVSAKLGDYIHLKNGFAFKSKDYSEPSNMTVPVIRISDINGTVASDEKANHVPIELAVSEFEIAKGDLLVAMSGATTGKIGVYWGSTPAYQNQRVGNLKLNAPELSDLGFRNHLIKYLSPTILEIAYGGAQPNISASGIESIGVSFPPLAEQKRIVEKLDEVLAQVDTIKARLDGIPDLLKRFRQSVLASAVSGKLTEEWRGENTFDVKPLISTIEISRKVEWEKENKRLNKKRKYKPAIEVENQLDFSLPLNWAWASVEALSSKVSDGVHKKPQYVDEGIPFVTVKNLTKGNGISFDDLNYVTYDDHVDFTKRTNPERGDILISKDGTLGVVRQIRTDIEFSIFVSVALVKPVSKDMSDYLEYAFMSPILQQQMVGVGTGLLHIHLTDLRKDLVPVPPIEEQKEIVRLVDQYFALADTIEAQVKKAQARVDNLTQSILAKAFRGELVAQDPSDEPADKLLERIAEARKEAEALVKAAKKAEAAKKRAAKKALNA
ncbi:restriction endonuclease subunit S [Vibrio sp. vnigr-6D03]|uniref:restriction endonuclease subunit S n=1 Tax=Vibrio sp. vnigr-6D03 TaxID=2058088 RepID=UPI0011AFBA9D|nr:restriction endonuclease subunit S [Vibrio sp. vnigr-6D03]